MVIIKDEKIDFNTIFKNCIVEIENKESKAYDDYMEEYYRTMFGSCYNDNDEDDWYDDYQSMKGKKTKKEKKDDLVWDSDLGQFVKKSFYKRKKKSRVNDDFDDVPKSKKSKKTKKKNNSEVDIDDLLYQNEEKYIYFYPDINKKEIRNEYNSLFELDEFLSSENIDVDEDCVRFLLTNQVAHCTTKQGVNGVKLLICENSWGNLVFTCCQNMDDLENYD